MVRRTGCAPVICCCKRWFWLAALSTMLYSCAPGADLPPTPHFVVQAYVLGAGDTVRITTFGEQDLTGQFRVSDNGQLDVPLLGQVKAGGLTVNGLSQAISKELMQKNLFRDPHVSVEVVSYRPVFILGEVVKPGEYPYEPGMTVLRAVAIAGGFTYRAVIDRASILRVEGEHGIETRAGRGTLLQPGDVVSIFERVF